MQIRSHILRLDLEPAAQIVLNRYNILGRRNDAVTLPKIKDNQKYRLYYNLLTIIST